MPGYQEMVLKAHEHLEELEDWYELFIDIVDWKDAAMALFKTMVEQVNLDVCVALFFWAGGFSSCCWRYVRIELIFFHINSFT